MPNVDLNKLGLRKVTKIVTVSGNPAPGIYTDGTNMIFDKKIEVEEAQPLLTREEYELLKDENWRESPDSMPGTHTCVVNGRRFMVDLTPDKVEVTEPKKGPGRPKKYA